MPALKFLFFKIKQKELALEDKSQRAQLVNLRQKDPKKYVTHTTTNIFVKVQIINAKHETLMLFFKSY